jgi:hypothetical protein
MSTIFGSIGTLLQYAMYLAGAIVLLFVAYKFRAEIARAWQQLLTEWRQFWARLFSQAPVEIAKTPGAELVARVKSFAEYPDPFATGQASRTPLAELVRYTFQAFEAWARDRGVGRSEDQTPHEFVRVVAHGDAEVGSVAQPVAELYCQIAYANASPAANAADTLQRLWERMRQASSPGR